MLSKKSPPKIIPEYSLTGDLLSYITCGLQYRYYNRASLPPSTPVQLWFGEFIHAVLEEAYRKWHEDDSMRSFPWDWKTQIHNIELDINHRLNARGLFAPPRLFCPFNTDREVPGFCPDERHPHMLLASLRSEAAINTWGPHLFPLITNAEVKLRGTREMPEIDDTKRRAEYYGISGIADVIASSAVSKTKEDNMILKYLRPILGDCDDFEIIIDYKGMRRPSKNDQMWNYHKWQVLTYAWLRSRQGSEAPVRAGIIFYLNELVPSGEDIKRLKRDVESESTDLAPPEEDYKKILKWNPRDTPPQISDRYKIDRSIRVIPVNESAIDESLSGFDKIVADIERSVLREMWGEPISECWNAVFREETCTACDFKTFCPKASSKYRPSVP